MPIREDFLKKLIVKLEDDYMETLELGKFLSFLRERALLAFEKGFRSNFGQTLFQETMMMLNLEPKKSQCPSTAFKDYYS
mmetsp:Transcript_7989/g.12228  ORF Transcript_7989/g.12228 Transcript_7989/m.12228 type:complete len:80 (-) Transcript_7989:222-461(-)